MTADHEALTLTPEERDVVRTALLAYRTETDRYLASYRDSDPPCCPIEVERRERRAKARESLEARMQAIVGALSTVGCGGPGRHVGEWQHIPGSDSLSKCTACGEVTGK